ncbi:hypothetical protein P5G51_011560 [Virgibacillus sp. 179-BFC.A HS]|uniref:Uncharacterized protein n=1 Tax=Tigheibacillus jepli TaxID=3035914 RepID=A0ABU5CJ21_9BACI|nr:hypothetical protein [Virgibacillus sp. 179-BFC.A HS]MDY0405941.1 hypothetical protein [Virgibacillus sp. 179-BFC.A HS]
MLVDNIASENSTFDTFVNKLEKLRDPSHVRSLSISEWKNHFYQKGLQIMYEQVRKKSLPYNEWIHRMLDKESDMQAVNHFIRNAARM